MSVHVLIHVHEGHKTSRVFQVIALKQDNLRQPQIRNSEALFFDVIAVAKTAWNTSMTVALNSI